MATVRPFAYNPTAAAITGATQSGNLAIGTATNIQYFGNWGGVKWFMGPDEDTGYVVALAVTGGNFPTPDGLNDGRVQFWRSTAKTDDSFISMANVLNRELGGTGTFPSGASAQAWMTTNNLWTSWTPAPAVDQIRAQLTSAQQVTYDSLAVGDWMKVTSTQYNNIVNNVAGATKKGNSDVQIATRDVLTSYTVPVTYGTGTTASFTIDTNEYVIAMISEAWNAPNGSTQLSYTTSFKGSTIINIGGTAGPSTGGGRDYFVRKAPTDAATETRYPVMRMTVSPNAVNNWPGFYTNNNGATWLAGANGTISKIQIITTTTKSW